MSMISLLFFSFIIFYRIGEAPKMSLLLFILALFLGFVSPIPMDIQQVSTNRSFLIHSPL
jgi:hypothetical protein